MSLIPNKKNKKDSRPGGGGQKSGGKQDFGSTKGKANTKAPVRSTKQTGGSQRGS